MIWVVAFAAVGAVLATLLLLFAGYTWLEAAKTNPSWSQPARDAAKLTGAAFIMGAVSIAVILAERLG